jgi:hypothetical protein
MDSMVIEFSLEANFPTVKLLPHLSTDEFFRSSVRVHFEEWLGWQA